MIGVPDINPFSHRTSVMQSGVIANRFIGVILAVSMLTPAWMGGSCCCFRKLVAAGACCSAKSAVSRPQKSCCARRVVAQSAPQYHPISPCRCHTKVNGSVAVVIRQPGFTTHIQYSIPVVAIHGLWNSAAPSFQPNRLFRPGLPPDAPARCALLCRWLA